jgi:hypothetical protein
MSNSRAKGLNTTVHTDKQPVHNKTWSWIKSVLHRAGGMLVETNKFQCDIWRFFNGIAEVSGILGLDAVSWVISYPHFERLCLLLHSGRVQEWLLGLLEPEDEDTAILRNVDNYSPNDTAPHRRRPESSTSLSLYMGHSKILVRSEKQICTTAVHQLLRTSTRSYVIVNYRTD